MRMLFSLLFISNLATSLAQASTQSPILLPLIPIFGPITSTAIAASNLYGNLNLRNLVPGEEEAKTPSRAKALPPICTDRSPLEQALQDVDANGFAQGSVAKILVIKNERVMYTLNAQGKLIAKYYVALGSDPVGHKQFEGDGKTPEGRYNIEFKNSKSTYNLALRVSYPNTEDREFAKSQGKSAGGDIMIHGFPKERLAWYAVAAVHPLADWTMGCIAVTDAEIKEIFDNTAVKTVVDICP